MTILIKRRSKARQLSAHPKIGFWVHEKTRKLNHYSKTVIHQTGYAVKTYIFLILFVYFVIFVDSCFF